MKKILFVNTLYGFKGGVEKYIHSTSKVLSESGYELYGLFEKKSEKTENYNLYFEKEYIVEESNLNNIFDDLKNRNIDYVFLNKSSNMKMLKRLFNSYKIITFVHDHDYYCPRKHKYFTFSNKNCYKKFNMFSCALCSMMVEKVDGKIAFNNLFFKKKLLNQIKESHSLVVMSDHMKENLVMNGFSPEKIVKVHPIQEFNSLSNQNKNKNTFELLFIGQLIKGKGLDLLIEAFSRIKSNVTLSIVGTGNQYNLIKDMIISKNLEKKVTLQGWQSDTSKFYKSADLTIVSSRWLEPFGLVGIESMSWGVPVVAFNTGGIVDWLKDNENGILINDFNLDKMALEVDKLLNNPDLRDRFARNGKKFIENSFNKKNFLENLNKTMGECHV